MVKSVTETEEYVKKKKSNQKLAMPLIRLKIENSGYSVIKSKRLNDYFINLLAN